MRPKTLLLLLCLFYTFTSSPSVLADGCTSVDFKIAPELGVTQNSAAPAYASADLDGDGKLDLAVADRFANAVVVLLNDGGGRFPSQTKFGVGQSPFDVLAADFNGDGLPDLAVTNIDSNNVSILLGTGAGSFGPATNFALTERPISLVASDFNGDTKLDLAVVVDTGVTVLFGNGAGSFSVGSRIFVASQAASAAVADFNTDGKLDLVVATFSGFFVLVGNGTGGFVFPPVKVSDFHGRAVSATDLNNDGKADLTIGSSPGLIIRLGDGTGGFSTPVVFNHAGGAGLTALRVADIDGDGKQDVAAVDDRLFAVTYFKGDGAGNFSQTPSYRTAIGSGSLAVGDFDNDGDPDIVSGDSMLTNSGASGFEAPRAVFIPPGGFPSGSQNGVATGDFNADGRLDLAVKNDDTIGAQLRVGIFLGDASGNFVHSSIVSFFIGNARRIIAKDFNNDGRADLVLAGTDAVSFSHRVSIILSNGDGTFTSPVHLNISSLPFDMATGDFNKDGNADLAVVPLNAGSMTVLLGTGSGGFAFGAAPFSPANLPKLVVTDFNSDTKPDLIVSDFFGHVVHPYLGDGMGGFALSSSIAINGSPFDVTTGDFNVDGKPDFATVSQPLTGDISASGIVSAFVGDGMGGFAPTGSFTIGPTSEATIETSDFDGDGKLDLAVGHGFAPIVSALSGDGAGSFRSPVSFRIVGAVDFAIGDFNADGRNDIATPNAILLGKPPQSAPCLWADDLTVTESDVATTADVTVHLSEPASQTAKVTFVLRSSSAFEGADFVQRTGTVTFQPGETAKTIQVTIVGDTLDEESETFVVELSNSLNARITDGTAKITIDDDDPPPTISINDVVVTETDSPFGDPFPVATFTVSLSAPSEKSINFGFTTAEGTATANQDFHSTTGSFDISPGMTSTSVRIGVPGDLIFEPDETFFVNLSNPVNATIADGQGQGTILNNDPVPTITLFDASASEQVSGDSTMNVTVRLSNPSFQTITVNFVTADVDATAGADYLAAAGTLTFGPGETEKIIPIVVKDDLIDEVHETFTLNISHPSNATIGRPQAVCTIFDNDGPVISVNDVTVNEGLGGNTLATFTVSLSTVSPESVAVRFSTAGGTATAGQDYQTVTNRFVTIPAGATSVSVTVLVAGDSAIEPDETFFANLTQPQGGSISDGQGLGTIKDDDTTSAQLNVTELAVNESQGSIQFTIQHVGDINQPFSGFYTTFDITASEKSDYNRAFGSYQFAPGELTKTITVFITDDAHFETPEIFLVALFGPNGSRPNSPSVLQVTINSNDAGGGPNPIDDSAMFVRQHYRDFLNREPDPDGFAFWVNEIESCGTDPQCHELKRINVSAAFFLSIEFQETGYLAYRAFKAAFGDATSPGVAGTVPIIRLDDFLLDSQKIAQGVIVGIGNWRQQLETNKNAYMLEFVQRSQFRNNYPASMTADEFVDKLDQRAGGVLSLNERADLIASLGTTPADDQKRAAVLRRVAEDPDLHQKELNRAFVLMEYYGYLRRNPDDPQDANFGGWKFWLDKLKQFDGDFINAEMVNAFLSAVEYRSRFGN